VSTAALLHLRGVRVAYPLEGAWVEVVRGVDLTLRSGELLGIVGESGSGKTQLLLSILGLNAARAQLSGSIRYAGEELLGAGLPQLNRIRGARIGMVFQDPLTALNPYLTVGRQIDEVLQVHRGLDRRTAGQRSLQLLEATQVPDAARRLRQYPHELSGGLRQRVMLAMALVAEPAILLADEPTTALDVTVQAQILHLLQELRRRSGTAVILVTHDLGVIAEIADRVAVMYAGRIVEQASVVELFERPRHPYTRALQRSIVPLHGALPERLPSISGAPPAPAAISSVGCAFAPRCRYRVAVCERETPPLREVAPEHASACHRAEELDAAGWEA
jgi:oligopeptide/dipeptide ABC transporter ATP-binding protein